VSTLVSVIIPTYNRADKIVSCIESVLQQCHDNIEIIVVDDGSSDNTQAILSEFSDITYIKQENGGASNARNTGIQYSSGKYVAFLDSDDKWNESKITSQLDFMQQHQDFAMCLCEFDIHGTDNKLMESTTYVERFPADGKVLPAFIKNMQITCSCMFIDGDVLRGVNGFNESYKTAEDKDLFIRIALNHKIGVVPEKLLHYQFSDDSLSNGVATGNTIKLLKSIEALSLDVYQENIALIKAQINNTCINYSKDLLWSGEYTSSRQQLKQCAMKSGVRFASSYLFIKSYIYISATQKVTFITVTFRQKQLKLNSLLINWRRHSIDLY
jgi:glycosyltransferase involved in cell wall biosynthesis